MTINKNCFFVIFFIISISSSADNIDYYNQANSYQKQNDYQSAYEIYKDLANNGDVKSMLKLGEMYEFGMGMDNDYDIAFFWYDKAANMGYIPAIKKIEYLDNSQRNILISKKIIKSKYENNMYESDNLSLSPERPSFQEKKDFDSTNSPSLNKNETKYDQKYKSRIDSSNSENHWILWLFIGIITYYFFKLIALPILRFLGRVFSEIDSFLYDRNQYNIAISLIKENLEELMTERRIGTIQGHFKKIDNSSWNKKKDYFIKQVIAERSGEIINNKNYLKIAKAIDSFTKYYENSSSVDSENLTGHQYEQYIANKLNKLGWQTKVTKGSGDNGVDIIAYKYEVRVAIQCKKYSSNVSNKAVQEIFSGKNFYAAQIAAVVTNNTYTKNAKNAASMLGVYLLNDHYLHKLDEIVPEYIKNNHKYYQASANETVGEFSDDSRTPEEILGLKKGFTPNELKEAFKRESNRTHPDKWVGKPDTIRILMAEEQKRVNWAYENLK